jgi:hypothetical protein
MQANAGADAHEGTVIIPGRTVIVCQSTDPRMEALATFKGEVVANLARL